MFFRKTLYNCIRKNTCVTNLSGMQLYFFIDNTIIFLYMFGYNKIINMSVSNKIYV